MKTIEEWMFETVAEFHMTTMGAGALREIVVDDKTFDRICDDLRSQRRLWTPTDGDTGKRVLTFQGPTGPVEIRTLVGGRIGHALGLLDDMLKGAWSRMRHLANVGPGHFAITDWRDAEDLAEEISAVVLALSGKKPKPPDEWTCDAHRTEGMKCTLLVGHTGFHSWAHVVKCQGCGLDTDRSNGWCGRVECVMARMESEKKP